MKKKLLATLLSLFMILSAFTMNVFAEEVSHDFEYKVIDNGRTIKILCKNNDCSMFFDRIAGLLTLEENNGVVSTNIEAGNVHLKDVFSSEQLNNIEYYQGETKLEKAPTVAGNYVAKITMGNETNNATAELSYTIYASKIGNEKYISLAEAIEAVPTDETETTIEMLNNETVTDTQMTIVKGKNIVLDLNGKTITGSCTTKPEGYSDYALLRNAGTLTIKDSASGGKITNNVTYSPGNLAGYYTVLNSGKMTLVSGTIEDTSQGVGGSNKKLVWPLTTVGGSNLTITGGSVVGSYNPIRIYYDSNDNETNVIITGGELKTTDRFSAIDVQIAAGGASLSPKGNITITGGTFYTSKQTFTGDGNVSLYVDVKPTSVDFSNLKFSVSGGKFYSKGATAFEEYDGGTTKTNQCTKYISGGLFSYEVPTALIADDYVCVPNTDTNTNADYPYIVKALDPVAKIGDKTYTSLAKAIAAIPNDGTETTITMIDDEIIEGNAGVTVPANKNIILDLNGHTISNLVTENKASQVIKNKGILTIKDSTDTKLDGTGSGLLKNAVKEGTEAGDWWSTPQYNYTTNVIDNDGTVTVLSGKIENTAYGSICYCIDNYSADGYNPVCYIKGGLLKNEHYTPLRLGPTNNNSAELYMSGGIVEGLYGIVLNGNNSTAPKVTIKITGGEVKAETYAFYESGCGNITNYSNANVSISGGLFGIAGTSGDPLISCSKIKNFISGGWFTKTVSNDHVYTGYIASEDLTDCGAPNNINVYTVVKNVPTDDLNDKEEKHTIEDGRKIDSTIGTSVITDPTLSEDDTNKIKNITVSNLNNAIDSDEKNYTINTAIGTVASGNVNVVINIQMNVDITTVDAVKSLSEKIVKEKGNVCDINTDVEFIDISINKITKANGAVIEAASIKKTDSYQLITFPLKDILGNDVDPEKVFIYRNHVDNEDTVTNTLFTKVEASYGPNYDGDDGECYWIDGTNLIIKAKYFSVYGIGKQETEIPAEKAPTPTPSNTTRYKIPNTGVDGTHTNNHSLLKLSSLSLLAVGTYLFIKKKNED